jgi:[acyl-carrier-protein] S-malonyltransferase
MQDAADALHEQLLDIDVKMPSKPVIHNQNARAAGSVDEIRNLLKLQLYQPVKWVDCVDKIREMGISTLIEMGPGKVLTGLARRIDKSISAHSIYDISSLQTTKQNILEKK